MKHSKHITEHFNLKLVFVSQCVKFLCIIYRKVDGVM